MIFKSNNEKNDLSEALQKSEKFAKYAYKDAKSSIKLLKRIVKEATEQLDDRITTLRETNYSDNEIYDGLASQLEEIGQKFEILPERLDEELDFLNQKKFSITLFGRTMAGKSTLMEVLTHGNGKSIGLGAQRTTLDVRTYEYKGLFVTDVPGIAAFEGEEDESIAFEAAKKSDLIIFLITNDAPQASEAECLNNILALGKPVICLINVFADISDPSEIKIFKRDLRESMDQDELAAIKKQFWDLGHEYGQDWHKIRFAYVHLKSAFLAQQAEFSTVSEDLYHLSRFDYVDNLLIKEVISNGPFYKIKAYSDLVTVPVIESLEMLFNQSTLNSNQGRTLISKRRKLQSWIDNFKIDGNRRIDYFISTLSSDLKQEISNFAEMNYDDSNASKKWKDLVAEYHIETKAENLLKQLDEDCKEELREISREIKNEMEFNHSIATDKSINMHKIIDGKRVWNWTTTLLSVALTIAEFFVGGPIIWAGVAVGIIGWLGSFLFEDRDKKAREARAKLEHKLNSHIDKYLKSLATQMKDMFFEQIMRGQLIPMRNTIDAIVDSVFSLSETQQSLANSLNTNVKEINYSLVVQALKYGGFEGLEYHVNEVARIPGYALIIVIDTGKRFPDDAKKFLSDLLKEKVWFGFSTESNISLISQAIGRGISRENIRIEKVNQEDRIVHLKTNVGLDSMSKNRVRLAQQLTGLIFMK